MTDVQLVLKRLAFLETQLHLLRARAKVAQLGDPTHAYFVLHALQLAIQAALDVASHVAADEKLGEPERLKDLFALLARDNWVAPQLVSSLGQMAGFRNVLVHGYIDVDLSVVGDILTNHLGDLDAFVAAIRVRLAAPSSSTQ